MKKIISLFVVVLLAVGFSACSKDDTTPTGATTYKITGKILDADGAGVENVSVKAVSEDGSVSKTTVTGSDGSYSFTSLTPNVFYTLTATSDNFYFTSTGNEVGLDSDSEVNFTAIGIYGTWVAEDYDVSVLLYTYFNIRKITATFNPNGSYTVVQVDSSGAEKTIGGTFTISKSEVENIFSITADQTIGGTLTAQGIFEISSSSTPFTMQYEVVQTTPDIGATPPTPEAGFGSTSGGAYGTTNIQKYTRQ
ncbi:MAG: carboxypeptidase-like regulatory domain-containing protein [Melioribacteraceae bacterium]|nr:carboxypeptidase-like regulatory domain-containing protein [Candidatus Cloacimonadota bacterium]MCF8241084.1 carboxypeptidase-like regulatory domain-containing protein [Melioribacteraceae bacterium]MCF8354509.1 carboxypeptidase-like regulatory domain-containing protein [Melioribacteraceae bacterium]MCF8394278.1 carboxypeptidase-like regulatory domain-containing protein [Melioribacteraceae bacterium]MCF8418178.1 carboxypeptidase-like regulatory domain-containing protein [Melioribacteraceae ba